MNIKNILIVHGEPNSTFSEILFKYFKSNQFKKNKKKIILIGCKKLIEKQMNYLGYSLSFNQIDNIKESSAKSINIINVDFKFDKIFTTISNSSNTYIEKCFNESIKVLKKNKSTVLINGPISKTHFLKKKYPGITEYIARKTNSKNPVMLIYNEALSVSPLTTHIPLKNVVKFVKKKIIISKIIKINNFYKINFKKSPNIAVLGLNPHCETIEKFGEEKEEIIPAIKLLKRKKVKVSGPIPADTFFLKNNIKKFDVVVGMYHDQVLTPAKTLFKFNAINVTIGLPFIKITPDHGPNHEMLGKNKSDPSSIFYALNFLDRLK